jgi:hypothetical protein
VEKEALMDLNAITVNEKTTRHANRLGFAIVCVELLID